MLLEELLAEEHVEVLVSLVGHVDDVGVLSWLSGLGLLFHLVILLQFNNASALRGSDLLIIINIPSN